MTNDNILCYFIHPNCLSVFTNCWKFFGDRITYVLFLSFMITACLLFVIARNALDPLASLNHPRFKPGSPVPKVLILGLSSGCLLRSTT